MLLLVPMVGTLADDGALPSYDRVRWLAAAREISDPALTDHEGREFRLGQLRGKVVLVFFGFTNCPDICPATMARFRQLERSGLVNAEKIAYVLVSVDAKRDTPEAMAAYLEKFSTEFIGATGDRADIKSLAKEFSAAFFAENPDPVTGGYNVSHSRQTFVLDPDGRLRAELYSPAIDAMAGVTNALLNATRAQAALADRQEVAK